MTESSLDRLQWSDPSCRALLQRIGNPTDHIDFGVFIGNEEGVF